MSNCNCALQRIEVRGASYAASLAQANILAMMQASHYCTLQPQQRGGDHIAAAVAGQCRRAAA